MFSSMCYALPHPSQCLFYFNSHLLLSFGVSWPCDLCSTPNSWLQRTFNISLDFTHQQKWTNWFLERGIVKVETFAWKGTFIWILHFIASCQSSLFQEKLHKMPRFTHKTWWEATQQGTCSRNTLCFGKNMPFHWSRFWSQVILWEIRKFTPITTRCLPTLSTGYSIR